MLTQADIDAVANAILSDPRLQVVCEAAIANKFGGFAPGSAVKVQNLAIIELRKFLKIAPPPTT